jgi:hypothetical protein
MGKLREIWSEFTAAMGSLSRRVALTLIVLVAIVAMCSCGLGDLVASGNGHNNNNAAAGNNNTSGQVVATATPKATPKPTATAKPKVWTTVQTFSGNGSQQTGDFTVANTNFRLVWSCNPSSSFGGSYNVIVDVDPTDTTQIGDIAAINTMCQAGNTSGMTNIHDLSGTLYLNVTSEGAWTIKVQVYE